MSDIPELERTNVQLNNIIEWPNNPRKERDDLAIDNSAANMRVQGQLMPLILAPTDTDGLFFAIDGETRRRGHLRNVDMGHTSFDAQIDCRILPAGLSTHQLLAIALAANTVREEMTVMDKMRAFRDLAASGMKPRAIGEIFNISSRIVEQHMALGNLTESAQKLVSTGLRQVAWAEAMTLGTSLQQEQIVSEIKANPALYQDGASVRHHLTRGNIAVSAARFDTSGMKDHILRDLFTPDGEGYFYDSDFFWKHQKEAVKGIIESHKATHKDVKLFDRERFNDAGWSSNGDLSLSTAIVIVNHDGTVEELTGMVPPAYYVDQGSDNGDDGSFLEAAEENFSSEFDNTASQVAPKPASTIAAANDAGSSPSTEPSAAPAQSSPLDNATKQTTDYLTAQVVAELKLRVASDVRLAMAFVIAQTLTRNGGLASSMVISGFNIPKEAQKSDAFIALDNRRAARDKIASAAGLLGVTSPAKVVSILLAMEEATLFELFSWTVAESVGTPLNETTFEVYEAIGVEVMASWRIEDAYLDTLSNAQIRALATEIVDISNLPGKATSINVVRGAIMAAIEANALQGNWVNNEPSWLPPQIANLRNIVTARADAAAAAAAANPDADDALNAAIAKAA